MKIELLDKIQVSSLLPMQECIPLMEKAFLSLEKGEGLQPLRNIMWLPDKTGALGMMPGYSAELNVMGVKMLSVFPQNKKHGLSSHQGVVILFETKTGKPLCMLDADEITAIRTAACSAVATKLLSVKNVDTLAILGSGTQAFRHLEAMLLVRDINHIFLWSRNKINAQKLADLAAEKLNVQSSVMENAQEAVKEADIICTVTASATPVLLGKWIKDGAHINAVGSCTPHTRELDTEAVVKSRIFTDSYESLFNEAGDFLIPKKEGALDETHVLGEIGEVLAGKKTGRLNNSEITLFKSLGISMEDIYAGHYIFSKHQQKNKIS